MYVRLAFAVAVNVNPDILVVDEVLAVGDERFQAKCIDRIRRFQDEGRSNPARVARGRSGARGLRTARSCWTVAI